MRLKVTLTANVPVKFIITSSFETSRGRGLSKVLMEGLAAFYAGALVDHLKTVAGSVSAVTAGEFAPVVTRGILMTTTVISVQRPTYVHVESVETVEAAVSTAADEMRQTFDSIVQEWLARQESMPGTQLARGDVKVKLDQITPATD